MSTYMKLVSLFFILPAVSTQNIDSYNQAIFRHHRSTRALADCNNWYNAQPSPTVYLTKIAAARCTVPTTFPSTLPGGWSIDPGCDASKQPNTCSYHTGAWSCYRHANKTTGPGAQACYDKLGVWISDPWKGAGTLDAETPLGNLFQQVKHYNADVVPYNNCCTGSGLPQPSTCNKYYEKRPPGVCA